MKKYLKTIVIVLGLVLVCFMSTKVIAKITHKNGVATSLQNIPDFSLKTVKGTTFTQEDLLKGKPTVFIYFNSGCDYCQHEAKSISEQAEQFLDTQILFISGEELSSIQDFATEHQLDTYNNITFLSDIDESFTTRFDATTVPYLMIYNSNGKLIKRHKGQVTATFIQNSLTKSALKK